MREKKTALHFTGRRHARGGLISVAIAGIAWIIFAALCVYSATTKGNAAVVAGIIGVLDAFFVLTGMFFAYRGFHERDVYYLLPGLGMLFNGILFVIYFSLYFMGVAIG